MSAIVGTGIEGGVLVGRKIDSRACNVRADAHTVFRQVERIGGDTGYYFANWIWRVRGVIDRIAGGPGFSRKRRDPDRLETGEEFECWRVAQIERDQSLRLEAAMKMPGRGVLEYQVEAAPGGSLLRQTAVFEPSGWFGSIYWYSLYLIHLVIWSGMLRQIARAAESEAAQPSASVKAGL
jgi:hypothetical protein